MIRTIFFALLLFLLPSFAHAASAVYEIDPDQTHVRFAAKMCLADILMGEFHNVKGVFFFDEQDPNKSHVEVTIGVGSASFNKEAHKGEAVKEIIDGDRFLKAVEFPIVTFRSTKVVKTSDITADVTGDMTIVGVTRPVKMEITFHDDVGMTAQGRKVAAFSAYGKFKRSDFGIVYGLDRIGIRRMDDEVTVLIDVAGNRRS
jgi:polyisoprenoid-binding protein YceI